VKAFRNPDLIKAAVRESSRAKGCGWAGLLAGGARQAREFLARVRAGGIDQQELLRLRVLT